MQGDSFTYILSQTNNSAECKGTHSHTFCPNPKTVFLSIAFIEIVLQLEGVNCSKKAIVASLLVAALAGNPNKATPHHINVLQDKIC